ncbi:MAG: NfeD family protein [Hyphomicrobiaceae bacterium]
MQSVSHLIAQFGPWLWFALAALLMVLETLVPGIHFLWFGIAAAIIGVLALLLPIAWPWQIVAFAIISVATVFWVRRYAGDEVADEPTLNVRGAQYVGRKVEVVDAIRNGRGKVRVGDTVWTAEGDDAAQGAEVRVTGVNGTVLVVTPLS